MPVPSSELRRRRLLRHGIIVASRRLTNAEFDGEVIVAGEFLFKLIAERKRERASEDLERLDRRRV